MITLVLAAFLGDETRCSDAEFLRRVTLDLAGMLPTAAEARAFLSDSDPARREKLVDRLLASADYPRRMEQAMTVMLLERRNGKTIPDLQWTAFLRKAFADNEGWDKVVRTLIAADGREAETRPAMKFLADGAQADGHRMTNDVARLFLGKNLLCAQCHDHPQIKDYKQADYMGLYAYLNQSKLQPDPKSKKQILVEGVAPGKVEYASVFSPANKKSTGPRLPGAEEIEVPKFEKGKEYEVAPTKDAPGIPKFRPRELLAKGVVEHPQFARTAVNRFWFLFMGKGLIHPLDLDHSANPPSDPKLLESLTADFKESGYEVKKLVRRIVTGEAYQRAAVPLRALSAEQMTWSVLQATGTLESMLATSGPAESKFSVKEYLNGKGGAPSTMADVLVFFSEIFGNAAGEPEVDFRPSMTHSLFLMNERLVLGWLKPRPGNLVDRLTKIEPVDALADELYLSILTRPAAAEERAETQAHLAKNAGRREAAIAELAWALIASAEFRLNH